MQCCKDSGVKNSCLGICTFNLDLDFLLFDSECIPEFDKAMACGSGKFQDQYKNAYFVPKLVAYFWPKEKYVVLYFVSL